jgi:hypothetical protein
MKVYLRMEIRLHTFLIALIDGSEYSALHALIDLLQGGHGDQGRCLYPWEIELLSSGL